MGGIASLPNDRGPMTLVQAKFAAFFGKVDQKRDPGWYWTDVPEPGKPLRGPYNGPFESKEEAVEHAFRSGAEEQP
jgi:hypothetical protein